MALDGLHHDDAALASATDAAPDETGTAVEGRVAMNAPHPVDRERQVVLETRGLTKEFKVGWAPGERGRSRRLRAVDGVDLAISVGETMSIVGESGCGKSTTAKLVLDLETPTAGDVYFQGSRLSSLRGPGYRSYRLAVQTVFQDPSSALNPRRTVAKLLAEPLRAADVLPRSRFADRISELLDQVGLDPATAGAYPHELSGGMKQRVAVAQALATTPSVIVLDEPVSALDVSIRAQIMNLLKEVQVDNGIGYLLIAHDLATVRYLSHQVAAMYLGRVVERASSAAFFAEALHPYTLALVSAAIPRTDGDSDRIILGGDLPSPADPPPGCKFHTRCWLRSELGGPSLCTTSEPELVAVSNDQSVACHFVEEARFSEVRVRLLGHMEPDPAAADPTDRGGRGPDAAANGQEAPRR